MDTKSQMYVLAYTHTHRHIHTHISFSKSTNFVIQQCNFASTKFIISKTFHVWLKNSFIAQSMKAINLTKWKTELPEISDLWGGETEMGVICGGRDAGMSVIRAITEERGGANLLVTWSHLTFSDPVTKRWKDRIKLGVQQCWSPKHRDCTAAVTDPHSLHSQMQQYISKYVPAYLEWTLDWQWWQYIEPQWHLTEQAGTLVCWEAPQPVYRHSWTASYAVMLQSDVQCHVIQHMCICGLSVHTPEGNKKDLLIKQPLALMYRYSIL